MFFSHARRPHLVEANPEAKMGDISKLIGAEWKELSEEDKAPYEAEAAQDKERYATECEAAGIEGEPKKKAKAGEDSEMQAPRAALRVNRG